jgi:uncharacterized membrane protein YhaH (DUF805 family)
MTTRHWPLPPPLSGMICGMAPWLQRLLTGVASVLVIVLLVVASIFIADVFGWESRGARRSVFGVIVLCILAVFLIGSEVPALVRRLRDGKPPPPKHKWKWPT